MKWLTGYYTLEQADALRALLEDNGIAVDVQDSSTLPKRGGGFNYGVYVALDSQFEDAVRLMNNPSHVVQTAIDTRDYYHHMDSPEARVAATTTILKVVAPLTVVLLMVAAAIIWLRASGKI